MTDIDDATPTTEGETIARGLTDGLVESEDKAALFTISSRMPEVGLPTGELTAYLFLAVANVDAVTAALELGLLDPSHFDAIRAALPSQIAATEFLTKRLKVAQAALEAKEKVN